MSLISCSGGSTFHSLAYVVDKGIAEESAYPSYAAANGTCQSSSYPASYFLSNLAYLSFDGDEVQMLEVLIKYGPMIISMSKTEKVLNVQ
jgi:Papain family cysteine protease